MKKITIYHGTNEHHIKNIEKNGLEGDEKLGANWFMVATDFSSALYHSSPDFNKEAIVFEFEIELEEHPFFKGHPFLWEPNVRNEESTWYGIKQTIPVDSIKKIHKISYEDYKKQKTNGLDGDIKNKTPRKKRKI
jgi:hypothetical protein